MSEINAWLKEWQPTWQFLFYAIFTGILGLARLLNMTWNRKLDEEQARKEGIDPEKAESR